MKPLDELLESQRRELQEALMHRKPLTDLDAICARHSKERCDCINHGLQLINSAMWELLICSIAGMMIASLFFFVR